MEEWQFAPQPGIADHPPRLAELQNQRLLGLVDDEQGVCQQDACRDKHHGNADENTTVHLHLPVNGRGGDGKADVADCWVDDGPVPALGEAAPEAFPCPGAPVPAAPPPSAGNGR